MVRGNFFWPHRSWRGPFQCERTDGSETRSEPDSPAARPSPGTPTPRIRQGRQPRPQAGGRVDARCAYESGQGEDRSRDRGRNVRSVTELRRTLSAMPGGSLVPVDWVIDQLGATEDSDVDPTAAKVALILDRAPSTIRGWCRDGRLPGAYRCQGREWRIPRDSLRTLRENGATPSPRSDVPDAPLGSWREVRR